MVTLFDTMSVLGFICRIGTFLVQADFGFHLVDYNR